MRKQLIWLTASAWAFLHCRCHSRNFARLSLTDASRNSQFGKIIDFFFFLTWTREKTLTSTTTKSFYTQSISQERQMEANAAETPKPGEGTSVTLSPSTPQKQQKKKDCCWMLYSIRINFLFPSCSSFAFPSITILAVFALTGQIMIHKQDF